MPPRGIEEDEWFARIGCGKWRSIRMEKDGAFRIGHFLGWITNDSHRGVVPQWPDSAAVFPLLAAAENDGGEVHTHGVEARGRRGHQVDFPRKVDPC